MIGVKGTELWSEFRRGKTSDYIAEYFDIFAKRLPLRP